MKVFFDTSVLIAGMLSKSGASRRILKLCELKLVYGFISIGVVKEFHSVAERKFPGLNEQFVETVKRSNLDFANVSADEIQFAKPWITDPDDAKILAAAKKAEVDVLLTLDIRDFIDDTSVAKKSGLVILTPRKFLETLRA